MGRTLSSPARGQSPCPSKESRAGLVTLTRVCHSPGKALVTGRSKVMSEGQDEGQAQTFFQRGSGKNQGQGPELSSQAKRRPPKAASYSSFPKLCPPSSLIPAEHAAPNQSWPPAQAAKPLHGRQGHRVWECTGGPAARYLSDLHLSSSFFRHVCDQGHKTKEANQNRVCLTLHMK